MAPVIGGDLEKKHTKNSYWGMGKEVSHQAIKTVVCQLFNKGTCICLTF